MLGPRTSVRKCSPRSSKSRYWSWLAQAGESSTTSPGMAASAASSTARSRSPQGSSGTVPSRSSARRSAAAPIR